MSNNFNSRLESENLAIIYDHPYVEFVGPVEFDDVVTFDGPLQGSGIQQIINFRRLNRSSTPMVVNTPSFINWNTPSILIDKWFLNPILAPTPVGPPTSPIPSFNIRLLTTGYYQITTESFFTVAMANGRTYNTELVVYVNGALPAVTLNTQTYLKSADNTATPTLTCSYSGIFTVGDQITLRYLTSENNNIVVNMNITYFPIA